MKLMFVGDINLGEYYTGFGHGPKSYFHKYQKSVFSKVTEIFRQADLVVGNLEAPITERGNNPDDPESQVLKVDPAAAEQLREAGIGIVQVANNHALQYAEEGYRDTLSHLQRIGVRYVGDLNQGPEVVSSDGVKIAFYAASDRPDNHFKDQKSYQPLNEEFLQRVEDEVELYDHSIVLLHWGREDSTGPLSRQKEISQRLKRAGVRAIIGSHPHIFYGIEKDGNYVCAYSLGNFVFDLCWDRRLLKSGILELDLGSDPMRCKVWPIKIDNDGCLPTPSGDPISFDSDVQLYDLGTAMRFQQLRKTVDFFLSLHKGDTRLKIRFISSKILKRLTSVPEKEV